MTEKQKNDLVKLFCDYTVDEITLEKPDLLLKAMNVVTPEELLAIEEYKTYYTLIKETAGEVEKFLLKQLPAEQVRECLDFLYRINEEENAKAIYIAKQLIDAKLLKKWLPDLQEKYKAGIALILDWIHFFISYTNSSRPGVNNTYNLLLRKGLPGDELKKNRENANLIPALLHKYFKAQRLNSFYDKIALDWSDKFRKEILSYSSQSFAFVQFVETEIFQNKENENYCYLEYTNYCKSIKAFADKYNLEKPDLCFYIISNPDNLAQPEFEPANLPIPFEKWATDISSTQFITLHRRMSNEELRRHIGIASKKIVATRERFFQNFISSL